MILSNKFTFLLIAVTALLIGGSGIISQDADAAAPTFTAAHINSTATQITFSENVNGTKSILDWGIRLTSSASDGDITS